MKDVIAAKIVGFTQPQLDCGTVFLRDVGQHFTGKEIKLINYEMFRKFYYLMLLSHKLIPEDTKCWDDRM